MRKKDKKKSGEPGDDEKFPLPIYDEKDDIYSREKEVPFEEDSSVTFSGEPGVDLDIPGSELDDADENIGEEDEENNYYSIGTENHDDTGEEKD
jgi:hypothetical protein